MAYFPFSNLGDSCEPINLQDMIECDMQTSFHEGLNTSSIILRHDVALQEEQQQNTDFSSNLLNMSTTDNDMSWVETVNINSLPENNNPNLLVNPQTGLPVALAVYEMSTIDTSDDILDITNSSVSTVSAPVATTVIDTNAVSTLLTSSVSTLSSVKNVSNIPSKSHPIITSSLKSVHVPTTNRNIIPKTVMTSVSSPGIKRSDTGVQVSGLQISTPISEFVNVVHALPISHQSKMSVQSIPYNSIRTPLASPPATQMVQALSVESQQSPLRQHLQNTLQIGHHQPIVSHAQVEVQNKKSNPAHQIVLTPAKKICNSLVPEEIPKTFPKPTYSYSCLIAMALKNSELGYLPVSEIYTFMTENFPYFKTAPDGWKNSVRHNLSLNKCFAKVETPNKMTQTNNSSRKVCLWGMNPAKVEKMEEEIIKWRKKDLAAIKRAMSNPDILELLEKGKGPRPKSSSVTTTVSDNNIYTISSLQDHLNHVNNNQSEIIKQLDTKGSLTTLPNVDHKSPLDHSNPVNVIEIKPIDVKEETDVDIEGIDPADTTSSLGAVDSKHQILDNVSEKDMDLLNATLDPTLNELVIQSGIFDETLDRFEDIPDGTSPLSLSFSSFGNSNSSPVSLSNPNAGTVSLTEVKSELAAALKARRVPPVQ